MFNLIKQHINQLDQPVSAAPLAVFRVVFGAIMVISMIRFAANGWISKLYVEPSFFFSYTGFEWVKPIGEYTWILFLLCGLSAFFVMVGLKYRLAIIAFFLSFTYIELMDKTTYLNHYYFVSILSFLLIFLPMNARFSLDAFRRKIQGKIENVQVPKWTIVSIISLITIVYIYAGIAKLNTDWLVHAMPLKLWLPSKTHIPIIGWMMDLPWVPYAFSWGGAAYDLCIPFLLLLSATRKWAYIAVVTFHVVTAVLFPIGMFPYIMIGSALIFFSANFHENILSKINGLFKKVFFINPNREFKLIDKTIKLNITSRFNFTKQLVFAFLIIQLLIPLRHVLYSDQLFWTEQGYRFSWRVMLMEKAGYANFQIVDPLNNHKFNVDNREFLTPFQEKQMSTQSDFILEYAHFLKAHFTKKGIANPEIYVESYVALNGRRSQPFINPKIDLCTVYSSSTKKDLFEPYRYENSSY